MDRHSLVLSGDCPDSTSSVYTERDHLTPEGAVAKYGRLQGSACHSSWRGHIQTPDFKKTHWRMLIAARKDHVNHPDDVRKWTELMTLAGMPTRYLSPEDPYGYEYVGATTEVATRSLKEGGFVGGVALYNQDYQDGVHYWVALTAVRYIAYQWSKSYRYIPYLFSKIYADMEQLDAYQCFILAHLVAIKTTGMDHSHGVTYSRPLKLLTVEQFHERCAKQNKAKLWSCNDACAPTINGGTFTEEMTNLLVARNYKEAYKLFL